MSRNRIIFLILLTSSLIFALLTGGRLPYLLFSTLFILLMFSYITVHNNHKNLAIFFWSSHKIAQVDDDVEIGYKLNNTGIFPIVFCEIEYFISKRLGNREISKELVFINPFQIVDIVHKVKCKHRGIYDIGKTSIKIRDIFYLFEKNIVYDNGLKLEVYPRVFLLERFNIPATEFFGAVSVPHNTYEDFTSINNLREYINGDNIKKIHWKISAKAGKFIVKNYELSANMRIFMFLDGFKHSYDLDITGDLEEKLVETTVSIARYCLDNNLHITLISNWGERSYLEGRDMTKFMSFQKELMHFYPNGSTHIEDVLNSEKRILPWGATLILLLVCLTERLFETILDFRDKGYKVMVITINNLSEKDNIRIPSKIKILKEAGVKIYSIKENDDIVLKLGDDYESKW